VGRLCFRETVPVATERLPLILAFDPSNQLAVLVEGSTMQLPFRGPQAQARLESVFPTHTPVAEFFTLSHGAEEWSVALVQVPESAPSEGIAFRSIEQLEAPGAALDPLLASSLRALEPHLIEVPYLHLGESDYIYKFRVEKDRNRSIYEQDDAARALYQSKLCDAIKALARTNERSASAPARLDFGVVQYVIPSHFGFCLGVKNAIERAYETLAENSGRRVFMLSELIHNPFVNEDLLRRGLRYLQTDKGLPFTVSGQIVQTGQTNDEKLLWDTLTSEDVVIIPAFGATDDDKRRLVRKGIRVAQYDATCMLVEKVWKAARAFGQEGFTVVIHGKSEHEETKATFSNTRRYAHSIIVRNLAEAQLLGRYVTTPSPALREEILQRFAGVTTPGFDPDRHLDRVAVVNQTTLLMNETSAIIDYFKATFITRYGLAEGPLHIGGASKKDTLCYATQVNQDALSRALAEPLDAAFVVGGRNSSNTYQLYRVCEKRLGSRAFFIQSEASIRSRDEIEHYVFPAAGQGKGGHLEVHRLWPNDSSPKRVLITGGASCPDGLVQQVIARINSLFPAEQLRSIDEVLADLQQ
jgi:4-hydroxy-3-methylbut-2-en-1-yl diphosphate reductase